MSEFVVQIDIGSHTRIIQEREYFRIEVEQIKAEAERAAVQWGESVKVVEAKYAALRRALSMLVGDEAGALSDQALVVALNERLNPAPEPPTVAQGEAYLRNLGLSSDEAAVHIAACVRSGQWVEPQDDGPPTETMPTVEQPPHVPEPYVLGRVFKRGEQIPEEGVGGLVTRLGAVWRADMVRQGEWQYWNAEADTWHDAAGLLHMHGLLWEVIDPRGDVIEEENAGE